MVKAGFTCVAMALAGLLVAAGSASAGEIPTCPDLRNDATIVGTNGPDVILGRKRKDDIIFAKGGDDLIRGRGGFGDRICAGRGDDRAVGRANQDHLFGQAGDDELLGKSGGDTFWPGPGNDLVDGGDSTFDRVIYSLAQAPVSVDLTTGEASGEGTDALISISDVDGSAFDDLLIGGPWQNELLGGPGDDEIHGEGGDDELNGGQEDSLGDFGDGGADEDTCAELETSLNCEL